MEQDNNNTDNELERLLSQRDGNSNLDYSALSQETQKEIQRLIDKETARKQRTWSWYEKLRKEDPQRFNRERRYMLSDAIALGDSFKDGNWEDREFRG